MFRRNVGYKLLALAIAAVIWAYANEGQNPQISKEIKLPLDVRRVDPGRTVTSAPKIVKVLLEGTRTHIDSITAEPDTIAAYVNLQGKTAGRHVLPVIVRLPDGLIGLVTAIPAPREAAITLEEKVERTLKVGVEFINTPPVGYRFGTPQISPAQVILRGTAEHVKRTARLVVAVDTVASEKDGITGEFPVLALDKNGKPVQGVELSPEKVRLRLELLETPASRAVFISVDAVGQPPFPHKVVGIEVDPQTVTVTGRPEQLINITTLKTEPVQLANHTKSFSQQARIIAPPDLTLTDGKQVRVTVKIEPETEPESPPQELGKGP